MHFPPKLAYIDLILNKIVILLTSFFRLIFTFNVGTAANFPYTISGGSMIYVLTHWQSHLSTTCFQLTFTWFEFCHLCH